MVILKEQELISLKNIKKLAFKAIPMFELENLVTYSLEVDFSNLLSTKETKTDFEVELLKKVNLGMLRSTSFDNLQIALGEATKFIPELEYTKKIGLHFVRFGLFENKRLRLLITKDGLTEINYPQEMRQEMPKKLDKGEMQKIDKDFNFLLGSILGLLKTTEMPTIKARLVFIKKGNFLSDAKLQALCQNVSDILSNPKTAITGFEVNYFDSSKKKHSLDFSQDEKHFRFRDEFEMKSEGPANILDICENGLKLANEVCSKICVVTNP